MKTLGEYQFACEGNATPLFTENETNAMRLCGHANGHPYVKDAFHEYVVHGNEEAVNPANTGTKVAPHYVLEIAAGQSQTVRLRLCGKRRSTRRGVCRVSTTSSRSAGARPTNSTTRSLPPA